jgi:hypothetical protein
MKLKTTDRHGSKPLARTYQTIDPRYTHRGSPKLEKTDRGDAQRVGK